MKSKSKQGMKGRFKVLIIGLGVQGNKRKQFCGEDFFASVDPHVESADFKDVESVPLAGYDAAILCTPDDQKIDLIRYLVSNKKHVLVEKPLLGFGELESLQNQCRSQSVLCKTAYNHRYEPHFIKLRDVVASGKLGRIYRCRMFYGNGTARLVKNSKWRDTGAGVLPDLGSHLIDTVGFWFGPEPVEYELVSANRFENLSPDHVVLKSAKGSPINIELEMTLLMWRNHFTCDILAENGTAHIRSLCKWGPTTFTQRTRVLPSGRPEEFQETLVCPDPTWEAEYVGFKEACLRGDLADFTNDMFIEQEIGRLSLLV